MTPWHAIRAIMIVLGLPVIVFLLTFLIAIAWGRYATWEQRMYQKMLDEVHKKKFK